jgi:hypothetical protein
LEIDKLMRRKLMSKLAVIFSVTALILLLLAISGCNEEENIDIIIPELNEETEVRTVEPFAILEKYPIEQK